MWRHFKEEKFFLHNLRNGNSFYCIIRPAKQISFSKVISYNGHFIAAIIILITLILLWNWCWFYYTHSAVYFLPELATKNLVGTANVSPHFISNFKITFCKIWCGGICLFLWCIWTVRCSECVCASRINKLRWHCFKSYKKYATREKSWYDFQYLHFAN